MGRERTKMMVVRVTITFSLDICHQADQRDKLSQRRSLCGVMPSPPQLMPLFLRPTFASSTQSLRERAYGVYHGPEDIHALLDGELPGEPGCCCIEAAGEGEVLRDRVLGATQAVAAGL